MADDSTEVEVLRMIWNEMKALRQSLEGRIDQTNARLEELTAEVHQDRAEVREELGAIRGRVTESEVRLATATTQLSCDVQDLSVLIREWRVEHRGDREDLRKRVDRIERHVGLTPP